MGFNAFITESNSKTCLNSLMVGLTKTDEDIGLLFIYLFIFLVGYCLHHC